MARFIPESCVLCELFTIALRAASLDARLLCPSVRQRELVGTNTLSASAAESV